MKLALIGLPGSGKTSLFNALTDRPVDLIPGVPGLPPHVSVIKVHDERLDWLCKLYKPGKCTPATLVVEDFAGIPPGTARKDHRGELFGHMRATDGLVVVVDAFSGDADPGRDLDLIALECLTADLEICERRAEKLKEEWRRPATRDRAIREQAVVERLVEALGDGKGAHTVAVQSDEVAFIKGFQLLTRKPAVVLANLPEEGEAPAMTDECALDVRHHFESRLRLQADLAALGEEERELFESEYGVQAPFADRFTLACHRGLGLRNFFTVVGDEVRAWTIHAGDDAHTAAGRIHTDLARGFIRAEVVAFDDLRALGSMREVKAKGKQKLEGKGYVVADGDILNVRFSV